MSDISFADISGSIDIALDYLFFSKSNLCPCPGDLCAESLKEEGLKLSLLVSSGWKMIRFNIIPVVQRKQRALKLHGRRREGGFPESSLQKVTQGADFIPSSYYHWR